MITIREMAKRLDVESDLMISIVRESLIEFNGKDIFENTQLNKDQFNKIIDRGSTEKALRVKEEVNEEYFTDINLQIKGTQQFLGKEINIVEGGFGSNQRVVLAKDIAKIHGREEKHINELINNNINRFGNNDAINLLKNESFKVVVNDLGLKTSNGQKSSFLLSERGYFKLVKIMEDDKSWEVHDKLVDEYFTMREVIKSDEQLKKELAYQLLLGGVDSIQAHKQLAEIEVKKAVKPLIETIEIKDELLEEQAPAVEFYNDLVDSKGLTSMDDLAKLLSMGKNKMLGELREIGILREDTKKYGGKVYRNENHNMPYSAFMKYFELKTLGTNEYTGKIDKKLYVNAKGIKFIKKRLGC